MNVGTLLVAKGMVSEEDIGRAVTHQNSNGGVLGDSILALGLLTADQVEAVLSEAPQAPSLVSGTGIDPVMLLELAIKGIYSDSLETASQLSEALKLTSRVIDQLLQTATDRKLIEAGGTTLHGEMRYGLTRAGREYAIDCLQRGQYIGPAPVTFDAYSERIQRQRVSNEIVSRGRLDAAFEGLVMPERLVRRLGPAINSGNSILIYGPAGNGKTTIAEIVGNMFQNVIYVPYCVEIDGEIMKVFDPSIHRVVDDPSTRETTTNLRRSRIDPRWVACYRPMVITGGELTIEMLDLKYNSLAKFYEAPLHIKALNGTFLIDDFGRQRAKPEDILNRWIVPLNSRIDFLTLHTGKSVTIPFDEVVIFSTNMHPDDLMDPAFQRRISYKLETVEPPEDLFRKVLDGMAAKHSLELPEDIYERILAGIRSNSAPLAYYQPKFIIDQVLASCKFEGIKPQFTNDNVDDALANLFVKKADDKMFGVIRS